MCGLFTVVKISSRKPPIYITLHSYHSILTPILILEPASEHTAPDCDAYILIRGSMRGLFPAVSEHVSLFKS